MKIKLPVFIFGFTLFLFGFYVFALPPKVTDTNFSNQALNPSLIIKFDKPVDRQKLQHLITPEAHGEWAFEDPLIKNHLFRTLVFVPAVDFKPDTQYQVKLENITSPFSVGFSNSFTFDFKTKPVVSEKTNPTFPEQLEPRITLLDIPLDWQDRSLSCEAASLKMALNGKGIYVSEEEIMRKIGYDQARHQGNVWGDPYQAYVGNIDGKICETGYGVYWEPVAEAANNWREAEAFSGWKLQDILREIESSNPVIIWGALPVGTLTDCSWLTPDGKYIKAYQETHVRLVIGFIGDSEIPSKVIINDPLSGRLYWTTSFFLTNWKVFGYSGVVIR